MDKIFNHTREELVEMFTPLTAYEAKVNEITHRDAGFGRIMSTADYKKNCVLWAAQRIEDSRMSKKDKEYIYEVFGDIMDMCFNSGQCLALADYDHLDREAEIGAKLIINEHERSKASRNNS